MQLRPRKKYPYLSKMFCYISKIKCFGFIYNGYKKLLYYFIYNNKCYTNKSSCLQYACISTCTFAKFWENIASPNNTSVYLYSSLLYNALFLSCTYNTHGAMYVYAKVLSLYKNWGFWSNCCIYCHLIYMWITACFAILVLKVLKSTAIPFLQLFAALHVKMVGYA
jgi:hypothetical protein